MNAARTSLTLLLGLAYPTLIWLGRARLTPRSLSLALLAVVLARTVGLHGAGRRAFLVGGAVLLIVLLWTNDALPLRLYPVLVNGVLLGVFGWSLAHPPTVLERFARRREPDLPDVAVAYIRRVTQAWCAFFLVNGAIALGTALWGSERVWWLYNGAISYALIGALLGGEFIVRRRFQRRWHADDHATA